MKKYLLLLFIVMVIVQPDLRAQCGSGESEITVDIQPDMYPNEISWELRYLSSGNLITSGTTNDQTVCVPESECVIFYVYDSFGDGIFSPGYAKVFVNGVEVFSTNGVQYDVLSVSMNCPPGTQCTSSFEVNEGVYTAPVTDFWYVFTADSTGNYTVSTCDLGNNCDTKIYIYANCPPVQDEGAIGVQEFNDNYCGEQSSVTFQIEAGETYFIRIGDSDGNDCAGIPINWSVFYSGPIAGCMDPEACNFDPLAQVPDNSQCIYPPPGFSCDGPDLLPDHDYLLSSMWMNNNHTATACEVEEDCILGFGSRELLTYGVLIWNLGNQPYYPGTPTTNPNGYEWAPCHGHYHYIGFAESYLYNDQFQQVDFARKTSYAIVNTNCLPGAGGGPALAPGCGDTYPAGYACQWVDVTDLDTGNYYLVLRVNGPQLPDFLGHVEQTFDNNATQVCLHLGLNSDGTKNFQILPDCVPFVDCLGVPLGTASEDCNGECNGIAIRGDLNADTIRAVEDLDMYMSGVVNNTLAQVSCNQLTVDDTYTVLDAARLNACIRFNNGEHNHIGGVEGTHSHCNFPHSVVNESESVEIGLGNVNSNYFDVLINEADAFLLGFEIQIDGVIIDSIQNVVANFNPVLYFTPEGHIMALATDEFPLNKYFSGSVLRVYYSQTLSNTICISQIYDVVNANAHRISNQIGDCVYLTNASNIQEHVGLQIVPNPSTGVIQVTIDGGILENALISISDPTGKILWQEKRKENRNIFTADLSALPAGLYYLTVSNDRFVKTERVIKQ